MNPEKHDTVIIIGQVILMFSVWSDVRGHSLALDIDPMSQQQ